MSPILMGIGAPLNARKTEADGRLQHDVRADAFNALRGLLQHAAGEADDQDDERDFHSHGDDADDRADRAVQDIVYNQLADHRSGLGCALEDSSPTRTRSVPAGCASSNRSGEIVSFSVSFRILISSL